MAFTESLTVKFLGDSSQLSAEIAAVSQQLGRLDALSAQMAASTQRAAGSFQSFAQAVGMLQQVASAVTNVSAQLAHLSATPVALNVAPALASLAQLSAAIAAVAAQLQALNAIGGGGGPAVAGPRPGLPFASGGTVPSSTPRSFSGDGLVSGPSGRDRIPAWLSGGEFVIQSSSVDQLGAGFLSALNQQPLLTLAQLAAPPARVPATSSPVSESAPSAHNTVNQFSDININVQQAASLSNTLAQLAAEASALRNRRG